MHMGHGASKCIWDTEPQNAYGTLSLKMHMGHRNSRISLRLRTLRGFLASTNHSLKLPLASKTAAPPPLVLNSEVRNVYSHRRTCDSSPHP